MGQPNLPDLKTLITAGIDPKNKMPIRMSKNQLKPQLKKLLRIIDEQDAVNRYQWYNLPLDITSQELERLLYYKGQLCFFYFKELDKFFVMPYALDGTIDFYGRFNSVHPIPMTSGTDETKDLEKKQMAILSSIHLSCKYAPLENVTLDDMLNSCVLLHDYTKQLSQIIIARQIVNDELIDVMAEMIPFMRTKLIAGTGIKGVRVNDADQAISVSEASKSMVDAALEGTLYSAIIGSLEFQELTDGTPAKAEEYLLALQALDNLRLSTYGLENGGLFEKKAHVLQAEQEMNNTSVGQVFQDGLSIRQNFCNVVNSIWGTAIWCEPSQNVHGYDTDGDGVAYDENDAGEHSGFDYNEESEDESYE